MRFGLSAEIDRDEVVRVREIGHKIVKINLHATPGVDSSNDAVQRTGTRDDLVSDL